MRIHVAPDRHRHAAKSKNSANTREALCGCLLLVSCVVLMLRPGTGEATRHVPLLPGKHRIFRITDAFKLLLLHCYSSLFSGFVASLIQMTS